MAATFTDEALNVNIGLFVAEESTERTLETLVGADFLSMIGDPTIPQPIRTLAANLERDGFLGENPGTLMKAESSEFSFSTYVKPNGALGVVPVGAVLWKGVTGIETINGSTSVVYTFSDLDTGLPAQTYQLRIGSMSIWFSGKVNQLTIPLVAGGADDGIVPAQWSILVQKIYGWAGTSDAATTDGATSTVTFAVTADANFYSVGGLIQIGTDDNSAAGWEITAIDTSAGTVTVSGTPTAQSALPVIPFEPTAAEPAGFEQAAFKAIAQEDEGGGYEDLLLTNVTLTLNNNLTYRNDEKDNDAYNGKVIRADKRSVTINSVAHFYKEYVRYMNVMNDYLSRDIKIPIGDVSGKICNIVAPDARVKVVGFAGSPTTDQTLDWTCYQSATGDDELSITFI